MYLTIRDELIIYMLLLIRGEDNRSDLIIL